MDATRTNLERCGARGMRTSMRPQRGQRLVLAIRDDGTQSDELLDCIPGVTGFGGIQGLLQDSFTIGEAGIKDGCEIEANLLKVRAGEFGRGVGGQPLDALLGNKHQ